MNPITMARAISLGVLAAVVAGSSGARSAAADPVADFYKGKTVQIIIGAGMGGSYGLYAQLAARHIADKIPGRPTVVVQSMPGAGGLKALAYEYNVAQKDGSVLAVPHAEVLQETVLNEKARFDAAKYGWIGRFVDVDLIGIALAKSGVTSLDVAKQAQRKLPGIRSISKLRKLSTELCYTLCITACASNGTRRRTGRTKRSMVALILKPHRACAPIRL